MSNTTPAARGGILRVIFLCASLLAMTITWLAWSPEGFVAHPRFGIVLLGQVLAIGFLMNASVLERTAPAWMRRFQVAAALARLAATAVAFLFLPACTCHILSGP